MDMVNRDLATSKFCENADVDAAPVHNILSFTWQNYTKACRSMHTAHRLHYS
jgi:hypothetical protein